MLRIVLLGKPGSGKGTQASMLSSKSGLPHLSSGAILREEIRDRTEFGLRIEEYVVRGEIGPQELITDIVLGFIERKGYEAGFILDGFPRTLHQAKMLDERYRPGRCVLIDVPDEIIIERISQRLTCRDCGAVCSEAFIAHPGTNSCDSCGGILEKRTDDTPDAVRRRLEIFRDEVQPVIEAYRRESRLITIDGTFCPSEVQKAVISATTGILR
jgi:adenylate kinase